MHQAVHPGSSSNEYICRKIERDIATRFDNKFQAGKTNSSRLTGLGNGGKPESPSRDRLIYLTTCLIGHQVEVQVLDGSVFSGIFHSTNADEDFGIILNMAHLGVSVTRDGLTNELLNAKQQELMTDACISQSRHVEVERELEPWVPDEDDTGCPELENIFDNPWNRDWDQFEANETLFGVMTTFNEELYTTKLEKGPQKGLEREAMRIAREIQSQETRDLHLAEERGLQLNEQFELDEETRFSSVYRGVDDSGCDEIEDMLDSRNDETFGGVSRSVIRKPFTNLNTGRVSDEAEVSLRSLSMDKVQFSETSTSREMYHSASDDHVRQLTAEQLCKRSSATDARLLFYHLKLIVCISGVFRVNRLC
ncbi:Polyadenylate-binding protein-interacting protein 4 [Abeliophyllum distichum]|uniref:Polyadenylate-binding protein-interacting protein 4 n=1 Tax=Abeliophyllum distichum TaxID=126358 RepID=A0ABD1VA09_9LAMI